MSQSPSQFDVSSLNGAQQCDCGRHHSSLLVCVRSAACLGFCRPIDQIKQNYKLLDIFSPQIERKRCKEYLVIILAVKESFVRFSCLEFIFEKSIHQEAGLKHKLKVIPLKLFYYQTFFETWHNQHS